jgi:hemolysin activation/secretion protein
MRSLIQTLAAAWLGALASLASAQPVPASSPGAAGPVFDILEFIVEGDTLIGAAAIERAVYPFLGPQRSAADAEAARTALEKVYQDAGYLSVAVVLPAQQVGGSGGEIRLQVVQAPVARLRVTGAEHVLPSALRAAVPSLAAGSVPNFNEMQQELATVSRAIPDLEVTPILAAGDTPGTMAVELKVQDKLPLHGYAEVNNKQSLNTERGRVEAGLSYDNLFQRQHSIAFNWFYSPRRPEQANIQTLSYNLPLGGPGDRLFAVVTHSDSSTPTPIGGATVSRGDTWRLRWRDQLTTMGPISHALTWGVTYRDLQDRNLDVAGITTTPAPLRYPSLSAGYDLDIDSAATPGRTTRAQVELTLGIPVLGQRSVLCFEGATSPRDQFACKRAGASSRFQVLGLTLSHREPLGRWWMSGRVQAQLTDAPLVPSEQVVYGGVDSVRGYYEGEQAGDMGLGLRLEGGTPSWPLLDGVALRAVGFFDAALLKKNEALPGEAASTKLASSGLGLRVDSGQGLQLTLDWARTLRATSRVDGNGLAEALTRRGDKWTLSMRQAF